MKYIMVLGLTMIVIALCANTMVDEQKQKQAISFTQSTVVLPIMGQVEVEIELYKLGRAKLDDLALTGYWSHTNKNGCDFDCRIAKIKTLGYTGENLAHFPTCDIRVIVQAWENSPDHKVVLDSGYTFGNIIMSKVADGSCFVIMNVAK